MQINTRVTNSAYYEHCSQSTYAENNLSVSFKMKYSENTSVNRTYEGRRKSTYDAYNELSSRSSNNVYTDKNPNKTYNMIGDDEYKAYTDKLGNYLKDLMGRVQQNDTGKKNYAEIGNIRFEFSDWDEFQDYFEWSIGLLRSAIKDEMDKGTWTDDSYATVDLNPHLKGELITLKSMDEEAAGLKTEDVLDDDTLNLLTTDSIKYFTPYAKYITTYSESGITCWKAGSNGYETDWSIDFENGEQYEKVKDLISKLHDDYNTSFSYHPNFWEDYLKGSFDETEFINFMNDAKANAKNTINDERFGLAIDKSSKWIRYFEGYSSKDNISEIELQKMIARQIIEESRNASAERKPEVSQSDEIKTAPYQHLADENGVINYKGVTFICDAEKNRITLGDCSDPNKCMFVTLKDGGTLVVNYDNIEDLTKAITMFTPEDQVRIMRAIIVHNMSEQTEQEIDDTKSKIGEITNNSPD